MFLCRPAGPLRRVGHSAAQNTRHATCIHAARRSPKMTRRMHISQSKLEAKAGRLTSITHATRSRNLSDSAGQQSVEVDPANISKELTQLSELGIGFDTFVQQLSSSARQQVTHAIAAARAASRTVTVPEPTRQDLRAVAIATGIPFIAFGIMDNALLIIAGDAIDTSFGVLLNISTMCAAALGNIVSDVAGVMFGTVVEDFLAKHVNLPVPNLTTAQRQLRSVRFANQFGCAVGMTIGCLIGMFPLLFIDSNKIQARKREAHLDDMFSDVINEAGGLIGAQRTSLFLVVNKNEDDDSPIPTPDGQYLYAKYNETSKKSLKPGSFIPLGRGIVSRAVLTGEAFNFYDVRNEPDFAAEAGQQNASLPQDQQIRNMVCVPVLDSQGRAIAVIQAINKTGVKEKTSDPTHGGFTYNDVQILKALASHITVSLQRMYHDEGMRLKDTITMLKEHGFVESAYEKRRMPLFPED